MSKRLVLGLWFILSPLGAMQVTEPQKNDIGPVLLDKKPTGDCTSGTPAGSKTNDPKAVQAAQAQAVQGLKHLGVLPADKVVPLDEKKPLFPAPKASSGTCK